MPIDRGADLDVVEEVRRLQEHLEQQLDGALERLAVATKQVVDRHHPCDVVARQRTAPGAQTEGLHELERTGSLATHCAIARDDRLEAFCDCALGERLRGGLILLDTQLAHRRDRIARKASDRLVLRKAVGGRDGLTEQVANRIVVLDPRQASQRGRTGIDRVLRLETVDARRWLADTRSVGLGRVLCARIDGRLFGGASTRWLFDDTGAARQHHRDDGEPGNGHGTQRRHEPRRTALDSHRGSEFGVGPTRSSTCVPPAPAPRSERGARRRARAQPSAPARWNAAAMPRSAHPCVARMPHSIVHVVHIIARGALGVASSPLSPT